MKCISCNYPSLKSYLKIRKAPRRVQVISKNAISRDKKISIKIMQCPRCTLVQLHKKSYVSDNYYDDYIMSRTHSSFSQNYQRQLAKKFIKLFSLKGKKIVDVGCGDGYFALSLKKEGARILGIEPSKTAALQARKRGITVLQNYVDDNFRLSQTYDAFVTCQVFEHIHNPANLLTNIKKFLHPNSFGLIEVPSLIQTVSQNRFFDFFPDHVAYYSPTSLTYMAQRNGFDVIAVEHTANNEYITAFIKRSKTPSEFARTLQTSFANYKNDFIGFFDKLKHKKVALWGAGAKGISLFSWTDIDSGYIQYCVDSDPNKWGKYLPGSHIQVVSPTHLKENPVDYVIVTAMMYRDEIIYAVKKFGYSEKRIAIIAPSPKFLV